MTDIRKNTHHICNHMLLLFDSNRELMGMSIRFFSLQNIQKISCNLDSLDRMLTRVKDMDKQDRSLQNQQNLKKFININYVNIKPVIQLVIYFHIDFRFIETVYKKMLRYSFVFWCDSPNQEHILAVVSFIVILQNKIRTSFSCCDH